MSGGERRISTTYADWLRDRDDDELHAMFAARPELITPVPSDLAALAARAAAPAAISRALDGLDRLALAVLEALLVLPAPATYDALTAGIGVAPRSSVDRLRELGLVWDDNDALRVAPGVRHAIPHPAGLGPPAKEAFASYRADRLRALLDDLALDALDELVRPAALDKLIDDAGADARTVLAKLAWGPPIGRVGNARRPVRLVTAASPIDALIARGLLAATDDTTVVLPREVALHLRQGQLFDGLQVAPPPLTGAVPGQDLTGRTAGGQAFIAVRAVEDLLERWGVDPPAVLRSGGLGIRDLRAAAALLDVEEWVAALLLEVAYAAGLLVRSAGEWLPSPSYDVWRLRSAEQRWTALGTAWLATDRVPGLAGGRDDRGRLINALADELIRVSAPRIRVAALRALATAPVGTAPEPDAIRSYLAWQESRRGGSLRDRLVGWTLREAEALGLAGLGALSDHARRLLAGDLEGAEHALAEVLPRPVDHVVIQADLTAIAPGPLITELGREIALAADVESTGGATVFRFTPISVRRALDAGRTASELIDLLKRHSATEVPQPLTYLIEDVARRHGHLRVGIATSYVRCDDPATLDEILADRRSGSLRLHRLAPTVLASRSTRTELLDALRTLGYAPVAESPEGGVVITRPDARRADSAARRHAVAGPPAVDDSVIAAAVRAIRAGDEAARVAAPDGVPPRSPTVATVERLRAAVANGARVWIGYLDQQGQASSRIVEPARVEGGFLTAYDATRAAVHRFALHRVTGVATVDDNPAPPHP